MLSLDVGASGEVGGKGQAEASTLGKAVYPEQNSA
jgi:hypothetical protein